MFQAPPGNRALLLAALAAVMVVGGCGATTMRVDGAFWLKAPGDPTVRALPSTQAGAPDVVVRREVRGTVADHSMASGAAADHLLVVRRAGGDVVRIYYRIGGKREVPVAIGDGVRIILLSRKHLEDDGADVGLLVYRQAATADLGTNPDAAKIETREDLVAVVQMRDIIGRRELPPPLRVLRATDRPAYHEAGTYRGECQEVRSHSHFRVTRPKLIAGLSGTNRSARYIAPGTTLTLDDGRARFRVLLLDNRRVEIEETQWCEKPEDSWSWAAVRVARPEPEVGDAAAAGTTGSPAKTEKTGKSPSRPGR